MYSDSYSQRKRIVKRNSIDLLPVKRYEIKLTLIYKSTKILNCFN